MTDTSSSTDDLQPKVPFHRRVEEFRPSKSDINNLVLNYLINEGYPQAAEKFSSEANIPVNLRDSTLQQRVAIRNAILSGNVEDAIERINDNFPTILDTNPRLHFALLRLQLIEIVRKGDMTKKEDLLNAVNFSAQQLAPRASKDPSFVEDLNYGMCLVVFNHDKLQPDVRKLLDTNLRRQIAEQVNEAILHSAKEPAEVQIRLLVQVRQWAEQKCREMRKNIPPRIPLGLSSDEFTEGSLEGLNGNGDADVMNDRSNGGDFSSSDDIPLSRTRRSRRIASQREQAADEAESSRNHTSSVLQTNHAVDPSVVPDRSPSPGGQVAMLDW